MLIDRQGRFGPERWRATVGERRSLIRRVTPILFLLAWPGLAGQNDEGLSAPTGVEASDGDYVTKVGICWDHIRNAKTYEVFRGTTNDAASATSVGTTASIIFYDSTAEVAQNYFYWVQAQDGNLASSLSVPDQGFRAVGEIRLAGFIRPRPINPPPVPPENPVTGAKVYLGKTLFWDEQLSSTRTVACGTCHQARSGSTDPRSREAIALATHPGPDGVFATDDDIVGSPGVPRNLADGSYQRDEHFGLREQATRRKALPVINAAYFDSLFWDGRAPPQFTDPVSGAVVIEKGGGLESQALAPLTEPVEMSHEGATLENVIARIAASKPLALSPALPPALAAWIGDRSYPDLFAEAFGTPEVTAPRIAMAIASYERTLYSDRAPLDKAAAKIRPLSAESQRGQDAFIGASCNLCHQGGLLGDPFFHNLGVRPDHEDEGRFGVTGKPLHLARFRAPSLRNVALRAPYMHNGRFVTLEEVIDFYDGGGHFPGPNQDSLMRQLRLREQEKADIIAYLKNELTDPRVASESGPLFDRPMLYSESARVPRIVGAGTAGSGGFVPRVIAMEPPFAGNPSFTVGLSDALGGAEAVLVIDRVEPGPGPPIPAAASLARETVTLAGEGAGEGYASVSIAIPNDAALLGSTPPGASPLGLSPRDGALLGATLFGRWYVFDGGTAVGVAVSPSFQMTVFGAGVASPPAALLSSVSAASLALGFVAPESIVSGFGVDLATSMATAVSIPLPTVLAGSTVVVKDSAGSERLASLFYCSPGQVNYLIPAGTAPGEATVSVLRNGPLVASGKVQVAAVAPALFTANENGMGTASALVLRIKADGTQTYELVARFEPDQKSPVQKRFVSEPIDLGPADDQVFLVLFGTGFRHGSGLVGVAATVGGSAAEVLFVGPQEEFAGVDQINLRLARKLAGRGPVDVVVTADGQMSNTVQVNIGP